METVIGGKLAADALIDLGIEYIFTISGGHITPIYQYLEGSNVKLFDTRHEQAACFMAEAVGRLTKKPGIAMVTAGPGFTNTLSAIANAKLANSPMVLISGCVGIESCEKLDLQDMRQFPVIEPIVKKAFLCQRAERIPEFIDMAYRTAITGRPGPVYLELPVDVLNTPVSMDRVKKTKTIPMSRPVDLEKTPKLIEMILASERPLIIAGSGAWYSGAEDELKAFAEMTGIPVMTVNAGRGVLPDTHELCFEGSLAIRPGAAFMANASADLVILLGSRISLYYLFGDVFPATAKMVHVDIEAEEIGRNRSIDLGIVSDVKAFLGECTKVIGAKAFGPGMQKKFRPWVETLKEADIAGKANMKENWESSGVPIHPIRLMKELNDIMDREDDIIITDGGDTQVWMGMTRTVRKAGHYMDSGLYGCLGVGIPYANASKLLNPDKRVLLVTGDGSVGFNFMEFETAIRKCLPTVVVINNDLGWGMIRHSQQLRMGHAIACGTEIGPIQYQKMVEAIGGLGILVEKIEDVRPAVEKAFASGKTCCINVMTDPAPISPGSVALANMGAYKA
ncbi:MAG TPA: thiamine pyrophosphate-binding protein [Desulfomonilia bacterium]